MGDDTAAIKRLEESFALQKKAFLKDQSPSLETRMERVGKVAGMMMSHRQEIRDALNADFGSHPDGASDLIECLGPVGRVQHVLQNLATWMKDDVRESDPQVYGDGKAFIRLEPKGVIGNIVPWNFPFDLSIGPLVEMLASGNRVLIKPSEYTPACAKLMAKMISETYPRDLVDVVVGDLGLSKKFPQIPWDHLLYTGSPAVGKLVMREAAANLTPVTLELGGKCPAILLPKGVNERNVAQVLAIKTVKNGQMCISVDTVHVHKDDVKDFIQLCRDNFSKNNASYSKSADCTGIISNKHLQRLEAMLKEAQDGGAEVIQPEEGSQSDQSARKLPISIVVDPKPDSKIAVEEIFGPLLPIRSYTDLDEVIEHINEGERPLGLYVFGEDQALIDQVLNNTSSGGACVNAAAVQGALPSMGFGGIGNSGHGRHHGVDGFLEFSNKRGMFVRGTKPDLLAAFGAPFSFAQMLADHAFAGAAAAANPPAEQVGTDNQVPAAAV